MQITHPDEVYAEGSRFHTSSEGFRRSIPSINGGAIVVAAPSAIHRDRPLRGALLNIDAYPKWQSWMPGTHLRLMVTWGRYDLSFDLSEPEAYHKDEPNAEVYVLDAGYFALDTADDEIAVLLRDFVAPSRPENSLNTHRHALRLFCEFELRAD